MARLTLTWAEGKGAAARALAPAARLLSLLRPSCRGVRLGVLSSTGRAPATSMAESSASSCACQSSDGRRLYSGDAFSMLRVGSHPAAPPVQLLLSVRPGVS